MEKYFSKYGVRENTTADVTSYQCKKNHKLNSILVSNYQYINWLKTFCTNHPNFNDDDWDFYPVQIPWDDYENVKRIRTFYEGILEYAKTVNYKVTDGIVFVKYGTIAFEIGPSSTSQYSSICCHRKDISGSHDFIDFDDIMYHVTH